MQIGIVYLKIIEIPLKKLKKLRKREVVKTLNSTKKNGKSQL